MDKFVIRGGRRLTGSVRISGAKNASLPIMAACLLTDGPSVLDDVPDLADINSMSHLMTDLGAEVQRDQDQRLRICVTDESKSIAEYEIVRKMRASICVLGPLLAKRGKARVSMPGGCSFGLRPVDLHVRGLRALGAKIELDEGYIVATAKKRLRGAEIFLGGPFGSTVLGTANVMMAATLAEGRTVIESAACEPEVEDLANYLNGTGAKITGAGTPRITIDGVEKLTGSEHRIIPDRIEAGTFMVAAAITNGDVKIENVQLRHLLAVVDKLREIGVIVTPDGQNVQVSSSRHLEPADVTTQPYPGFPTDLQAQLIALLCLSNGNSVITEKIYPERFMHVAELLRMGADIRKEGPTAIVTGVKNLIGAPVMASDLRASAALVLAGLVAKGETTVKRIYHVDRGYERIEDKLNNLGANIQRIPE
ncbi:MAG: UDP-N-acetylglucosamine 1-carboxyvinyltransferase [bacterium]|nr:UDP-N-acetylglucosamine 1-carboxyvinyltransferase [bacterium]